MIDDSGTIPGSAVNLVPSHEPNGDGDVVEDSAVEDSDAADSAAEDSAAALDPTPDVARRSGGLLVPLLVWTMVAVLLALAAAAAVGSVNRTVYGAADFVHEYLNALNRHDADAALAFPGVDLSPTEAAAAGLPADAARVLLRSSMTANIEEIEVVGDEVSADGTHLVTMSYRLDSSQNLRTSSYRVEATEPRLGLFNTWTFTTSPLAAVNLTVLHENIFEVNGLLLDTRTTHPEQPAGFLSAADYLVFSPGHYTFSHESRLLSAAPVSTVVTEPGSTTEVEVDAAANDEFVNAVQAEVNEYLDACAKQEVLQPAGCPFGHFIENRLIGLPSWSISTYPPVSLTPGEHRWEMDATGGQAHLRGEVLSLFDGTVSELDATIDFTISLTASIRPDGSLDIRVV